VYGGIWRPFQHIPLNYSAAALKNLPGGVQTNRDNAIQIEICARAAEVGNLPEDAYRVVARVLVYAHQVKGVPLQSSVRFAGLGEGMVLASVNSPIRLSGGAWDKYTGVLGHQHVPENDHWDPGKFDIQKLLRYARELVPTTPVPLPPPANNTNRFVGYPTLRLGARDTYATGRFPDLGAPVQTLQNALNIALRWEGDNPNRLVPDGDFGLKTNHVVGVYQRLKVGSSDGVVGPLMWAMLDRDLDALGR